MIDSPGSITTLPGASRVVNPRNGVFLWLARRFLIINAALVVILSVVGIFTLGIKADWLAFYTAGYGVLSGNAHNLYNFPIFHGWQAPYLGSDFVAFLYAPAYSLLFVPLAGLPAQVARVVWLLIGLAALVIAARLSREWTSLNTKDSLLGLFAFAPLAYSLAVGQITPVTLLLFCAALRESRRDHPFRSGLLLGAALYKPQLLVPIFLFWLSRKEWRQISGMLFAGAIVAVLSILVSPAASSEYVRLTLNFLQFAKITTDTGANASLFALSPIAGVISSILVCLLLVISNRYPVDSYLEAMVWLAPFFFTPYLGFYDLMLLILPISLLLPQVRKDRLVLIAIALVWLTPLLAIVVTNNQIITISGLILFAVCVFRVFQPKLLFV